MLSTEISLKRLQPQSSDRKRSDPDLTKEEMSETDVIRIVEQGQDDHGLTLMPEGPQPGSTPADFSGIEDQVKSETPDTGGITFDYDHWQNAIQNSKKHKSAHSEAFDGWKTSIYMDAAREAVTPEKVQQALRSYGIKVDLKDLMPTEVGPTRTPGIFYYVDFGNLSVPNVDYVPPSNEIPK